jgi:hypothetical protein
MRDDANYSKKNIALADPYRVNGIGANSVWLVLLESRRREPALGAIADKIEISNVALVDCRLRQQDGHRSLSSNDKRLCKEPSQVLEFHAMSSRAG